MDSFTGSFQNLVSVVVPTTIPRYSAFHGIGWSVLGHTVGLTERARVLDRGHAQEAETGLVKCNVFGNLTCKIHEALLRLETMTTYGASRRDDPSEWSLCSYAYLVHA